MSADPRAEILPDEDFCRRMAAARTAKGMSQAQLAARIGVSQPSISAIESGHGSTFIPDVCRILKIPGPMHGWSELQRQWAVVGHKLEERSPATFKMAMTMIQQMLDELQAPPETPPSEPPPVIPKAQPLFPKKKTLRPIGSGDIGPKKKP